MPKMKTKTGAKKRFKISPSGRIKRSHAYKRHILTKKSPKRKRRLRQRTDVDSANVKLLKRMLPYL